MLASQASQSSALRARKAVASASCGQLVEAELRGQPLLELRLQRGDGDPPFARRVQAVLRKAASEWDRPPRSRRGGEAPRTPLLHRPTRPPHTRPPRRAHGRAGARPPRSSPTAAPPRSAKSVRGRPGGTTSPWAPAYVRSWPGAVLVGRGIADDRDLAEASGNARAASGQARPESGERAGRLEVSRRSAGSRSSSRIAHDRPPVSGRASGPAVPNGARRTRQDGRRRADRRPAARPWSPRRRAPRAARQWSGRARSRRGRRRCMPSRGRHQRGGIRNPASSRITSPFRYGFSTMCLTSAANSSGRPSRCGNGICASSASLRSRRAAARASACRPGPGAIGHHPDPVARQLAGDRQGHARRRRPSTPSTRPARPGPRRRRSRRC